MSQYAVPTQKIKVLIIDNSALVRGLLKEVINSCPEMQAVGVAANPVQALDMFTALKPDVVTLDMEMPEMDGLIFLEKLMRLRPTPVLIISSLTERGSQAALRALELGAVDFLAKPRLGISEGMREYGDDITDKIRAASLNQSRMARQMALRNTSHDALPDLGNRITSTEKIIILGASTGGTEAIKEFLIQLPADAPGILIAQHMPEAFTKSFAARLDSLCKIRVIEAQGNERILPGHAFIAPGHSHLLLKRSGANYMTELSQSAPVNHHRPSVEVLFRSAAKHAGKNVIGVMLTGMGKDGANAMLEMRQAGAYNFAQNEETCVVFGMPREAIAVGAVDEVVPIQNMAQRVLIKLAQSGARNLAV
jgi:two-component system chemotaxis response regulator CheB